MKISILSMSAKKKKIAQEVMIWYHIWVWGDRRQNAGSLGFDPTGWTRAISFFLHVYFHPLHEVWPKVMIIIITRLLAVDPLKLVIDTRLTQSIYAFFFADMPTKTYLLPRWTKSKNPYFYNGSWNWHRNGWIENKYLIVGIADIFPFHQF